MKRFLWVCVAIVATALNAHAITFDFETVAGLTALNTNVQGTSLPANSSIVNEIPGLVISSLGPSKNVGDINGDGSDDMFSGVSWLDFTGTGSTAHSGTKVIAGANDDPTDSTKDIVDFNNFVEFRLLNPGTKFFQIWVELLPGITSVQAIFRDEINGGGTDLKTTNITSSGLVNFLSPGADIRNVVFLPVGGGIWLDDLTIAASDPNGGGGGSTVPEPGSFVLLATGAAALVLAGKRMCA